jgi:uncharacterized membrane protein
METQLLIATLGIAALAAGLVAGVFLTFSDFVMRSLAAAEPRGGAEAMQEINRKVYRSIFMVLLLGMVPVSVVIAFFGIASVPGLAGITMTLGGAFYTIGVFLVTVFFNVPMNKRLDAMDISRPATLDYWRLYARRWTWWNHVRSATAAMAAITFGASAILIAGAGA